MDAVLGGAIAGVVYGASNLTTGIRSQVSANPAMVPNPNGRLGGPAHQAEIWNIEIQIKKQGLIPKTEYRIDTPGGLKPYRFADIAALDVNENPVVIYQVGKATNGNLPNARERQAITDIFEFSGYDIPIVFIPYW